MGNHKQSPSPALPTGLCPGGGQALPHGSRQPCLSLPVAFSTAKSSRPFLLHALPALLCPALHCTAQSTSARPLPPTVGLQAPEQYGVALAGPHRDAPGGAHAVPPLPLQRVVQPGALGEGCLAPILHICSQPGPGARSKGRAGVGGWGRGCICGPACAHCVNSRGAARTGRDHPSPCRHCSSPDLPPHTALHSPRQLLRPHPTPAPNLRGTSARWRCGARRSPRAPPSAAAPGARGPGHSGTRTAAPPGTSKSTRVGGGGALFYLWVSCGVRGFCCLL